jgi:hypothetical protein
MTYIVLVCTFDCGFVFENIFFWKFDCGIV